MSTGFVLRVCHGKTGRLRFLSHLELVRALERAVRRADLPFAVSHGFSPHMRMALGPALPVGSAGLAEWLDIPLTEFVPTDEAIERLAATTPRELAPVRVGFVPPSSPSLSSALTAARYSVLAEGVADPSVITAGMAQVLSRGTIEVARKGKVRTFDLGDVVWEEPSVQEGCSGCVVSMGLRLGAEGSLRPEALVTEALEYSEADVSALVVTRTSLFAERDGGLLDPLD